MKFPIKSIKPNPFRDPANFPIQAEKIEALRESIHATEYWGNILARLVDGGAELAYGHHRIEALRQVR
jgi:ParB-like chromosome segregation protein Spo0J